MSQTVFAADKPSDCRFCYYWNNKESACFLGKDKCYYLITTPQMQKSECDGCPYGQYYPCIGWCTKKILRELRDHRDK